MAIIRINGNDIDSDAIESAVFHAEGSSREGHIIGEPPVQYRDDELDIVLKPNTPALPIQGAEARRIADELEAAGVFVLRYPLAQRID